MAPEMGGRMRWWAGGGWVAGLLGALLGLAPSARAHVVAGARVFPVTLTFDDPGVGDEVSLPALSYSRSAADGGPGPGHEVDLGLEFDKTITSDTAVIFNDGFDIQQMNHAKTQSGWENLVITGKWQLATNAAHEAVVSLGVQRELGGTGTIHTGADHYGSTAPVLYVGKGFGDLPVDWLRPVALTGELSYSVADRALKEMRTTDALTGVSATSFNSGNSNAWNGGVSVQYSLPYLQSEVRDVGLRGVLSGLIPLVEFDWSSPASAPAAQGTTWTAAPGVIWLGRWGEVGLEAVLPLNRAAGPNAGVLALVHLYLDDLLPHSLGRPLIP